MDDLFSVSLNARPIVVNAGRFPHHDQWFETQYCSNHNHAVHLYEYPCLMRFGESEVDIRPGDVTISLQDKSTCYHLPVPGQHWCIHFRQDISAKARQPLVVLPWHIRLGVRAYEFTPRFVQVTRWHRVARNDPVAQAAASAALHELLLALTALPDRANPCSRHADLAVEEAAKYLDRNLARPVNVPQLAKAVDLSQNYLARRFRQRFGMTLAQYLLTRRIEHACQLLGGTDLPIGRVAALIGLPDPQYFNKQFRRLLGMSPTVYRQRTCRS